MAGKTTSAGYRIPVTSEYHQKCIAKSMKIIRDTTERFGAEKTFSQVEYRNCNAVAQERLWKEHVHNEIKATKEWDKDWGFLLEYDYQGLPRQKKQLPENLSFYETGFPVTTSRHFGQYPETMEVRRIEKTNYHKKTKTDLEKYYS